MPVINIQNWKTAAAPTPSLPAFTNIALNAALWNFNPVGYSGGQALYAPDSAGASIDAPYPQDWAGAIAGNDPPPWRITTFDDQNSNTNDLVQGNSSKQPVVQLTTPVIVTGGSQPGVYTYRGFYDAGGGPGLLYTLLGQPTNALAYGLINNLGNGAWEIYDGSAVQLYQSNDDPSFPWLASWTGITVAPGTQTGQIDFGTDGAGNAVITGLQSSGNLTLGTAFTLYLLVKINDLSATGTLFETTANGVTTTGGISVRSVAGVLTAGVKAAGGLNQKIKTISDTNWHFVTVVIDTTLSAANQVKLLVDNSTTGVTAPVATDLASLTLANQKANIGARNNAASDGSQSSMQDISIKTVAENATLQTAMYAYVKTLNTALP